MPLSNNYSARVLLISGWRRGESQRNYGFSQLILEDDFLKKELVGDSKYDNNEYQFSVRSGNYKIDFGKLMNIE